jgi:hypothetical protein
LAVGVEGEIELIATVPDGGQGRAVWARRSGRWTARTVLCWRRAGSSVQDARDLRFCLVISRSNGVHDFQMLLAKSGPVLHPRKGEASPKDSG